MRREAIHAVFPARDMAVQSAPHSQEGASSIAHVTSIRHAHRHPHPPARTCHRLCLSPRARCLAHAGMHTNLKSNSCVVLQRGARKKSGAYGNVCLLKKGAKGVDKMRYRLQKPRYGIRDNNSPGEKKTGDTAPPSHRTHHCTLLDTTAKHHARAMFKLLVPPPLPTSAQTPLPRRCRTSAPAELARAPAAAPAASQA